MNVKQFLKPDWRKIVIFVILIVITIVSYFLSIRPALPPNTLEQDYFGKEVDVFIWSIMDNILLVLGWPIILLNGAICLDLIWLYLISCLIVWVYDKVKKK